MLEKKIYLIIKTVFNTIREVDQTNLSNIGSFICEETLFFVLKVITVMI